MTNSPKGDWNDQKSEAQMIVYIAGKISGNPDYRRQFSALAAHVRKAGAKVINPATLPEMDYHKYPSINLAMIDAADAIIMLPNWQDSVGAAWEMAFAKWTGKKILYAEENE